MNPTLLLTGRHKRWFLGGASVDMLVLFEPWTCAHCLREQSKRGLPLAVLRQGRLRGHYEDGTCQYMG